METNLTLKIELISLLKMKIFEMNFRKFLAMMTSKSLMKTTLRRHLMIHTLTSKQLPGTQKDLNMLRSPNGCEMPIEYLLVLLMITLYLTLISMRQNTKMAIKPFSQKIQQLQTYTHKLMMRAICISSLTILLIIEVIQQHSNRKMHLLLLQMEDNVVMRL